MPNTGETFGLIERLAKLAVAAVGIERPHGPLVEAMLGAGLRVVVITPWQVKVLRSRYSAAGVKSDPRKARVALVNQLTAQLERCFPGAVGVARAGHGVRAARLLAEVGDVRSRFPDEEALAALAGVAPVTRASGKARSVGFGWAGDKQLRAALVDFADHSRRASPWAAHLFAQALARTRRHPHAVRILARAWVRVVIWRLWQDGAAYDPAGHQGAVRLLATQP